MLVSVVALEECTRVGGGCYIYIYIYHTPAGGLRTSPASQEVTTPRYL